MPIPGVEQPAILPVNDAIRLRKFDHACDFALAWYQDAETVYLVDGVRTPYTPETLHRMYAYLDAHGELYFIEAKEGDAFVSIGDVTFWQEDMPIVIGERAYRGRGIGGAVVQRLIERGRALGYDTLYVREIYAFNAASRRCFERLGFQAYERTAQGNRFRLPLR